MNKLKSKELEGAIRFGQTISSIDYILGYEINLFESDFWSEYVKRKSVANLSVYRKLVQAIVEQVDSKYKGIKIAERAKKDAQKILSELEAAARPYM